MLMLMSFLQSDVNSVCFVDDSGHLICSGSDDSFCKVIPNELANPNRCDQMRGFTTETK